MSIPRALWGCALHHWCDSYHFLHIPSLYIPAPPGASFNTFIASMDWIILVQFLGGGWDNKTETNFITHFSWWTTDQCEVGEKS
jgi:hypothetical protein